MTSEMVACHYANRSGRGNAATFLPIYTVREMVEAGLAIWDKRCKYVNFTKTEAEVHRADLSLTMGPNVTEQAAMGSPYHMALVQAWAA